jgi:hypothetical protein
MDDKSKPDKQLDMLKEWDERLGRKLRAALGLTDTGTG